MPEVIDYLNSNSPSKAIPHMDYSQLEYSPYCGPFETGSELIHIDNKGINLKYSYINQLNFHLKQLMNKFNSLLHHFNQHQDTVSDKFPGLSSLGAFRECLKAHVISLNIPGENKIKQNVLWFQN